MNTFFHQQFFPFVSKIRGGCFHFSRPFVVDYSDKNTVRVFDYQKRKHFCVAECSFASINDSLKQAQLQREEVKDPLIVKSDSIFSVHFVDSFSLHYAAYGSLKIEDRSLDSLKLLICCHSVVVLVEIPSTKVLAYCPASEVAASSHFTAVIPLPTQVWRETVAQVAKHNKQREEFSGTTVKSSSIDPISHPQNGSANPFVLCAGFSDGVLRIIDPFTQQILYEIAPPDTARRAALVSLSLLNPTQLSPSLRTAADCPSIDLIHPHLPFSCVLAGAYEDGTLALWRLRELSQCGTLQPTAKKEVLGVSVRPFDCSLLFVDAATHTLCYHILSPTPHLQQTLAHPLPKALRTPLCFCPLTHPSFSSRAVAMAQRGKPFLYILDHTDTDPSSALRVVLLFDLSSGVFSSSATPRGPTQERDSTTSTPSKKLPKKGKIKIYALQAHPSRPELLAVFMNTGTGILHFPTPEHGNLAILGRATDGQTTSGCVGIVGRTLGAVSGLTFDPSSFSQSPLQPFSLEKGLGPYPCTLTPSPDRRFLLAHFFPTRQFAVYGTGLVPTQAGLPYSAETVTSPQRPALGRMVCAAAGSDFVWNNGLLTCDFEDEHLPSSGAVGGDQASPATTHTTPLTEAHFFAVLTLSPHYCSHPFLNYFVNPREDPFDVKKPGKKSKQADASQAKTTAGGEGTVSLALGDGEELFLAKQLPSSLSSSLDASAEEQKNSDNSPRCAFFTQITISCISNGVLNPPPPEVQSQASTGAHRPSVFPKTVKIGPPCALASEKEKDNKTVKHTLVVDKIFGGPVLAVCSAESLVRIGNPDQEEEEEEEEEEGRVKQRKKTVPLKTVYHLQFFTWTNAHSLLQTQAHQQDSITFPQLPQQVLWSPCSAFCAIVFESVVVVYSFGANRGGKLHFCGKTPLSCRQCFWWLRTLFALTRDDELIALFPCLTAPLTSHRLLANTDPSLPPLPPESVDFVGVMQNALVLTSLNHTYHYPLSSPRLQTLLAAQTGDFTSSALWFAYCPFPRHSEALFLTLRTDAVAVPTAGMGCVAVGVLLLLQGCWVKAIPAFLQATELIVRSGTAPSYGGRGSTASPLLTRIRHSVMAVVREIAAAKQTQSAEQSRETLGHALEFLLSLNITIREIINKNYDEIDCLLTLCSYPESDFFPKQFSTSHSLLISLLLGLSLKAHRLTFLLRQIYSNSTLNGETVSNLKSFVFPPKTGVVSRMFGELAVETVQYAESLLKRVDGPFFDMLKLL